MHATEQSGYPLPAHLVAELRSLHQMSVGELGERFQALFGVPTRTRNKQYLRKRIALRIQEEAFGGLSSRALDKIEQLAPQAPLRWKTTLPSEEVSRSKPGRDPRLPPVGSRLSRAHDGVEHTVVVLEDGFEYAGKRFRTLSQVAKAITGTEWNGFLFFGLAQRKPSRGG